MEFTQAELEQIAKTMLNSLKSCESALELEEDGVKDVVDIFKRFSMDLAKRDDLSVELFRTYLGDRPFNPKLVGILKMIGSVVVDLLQKRFLDLRFDQVEEFATVSPKKSDNGKPARKKVRIVKPLTYTKWNPRMYMFIMSWLRSHETNRQLDVPLLAKDFGAEFDLQIKNSVARYRATLVRSAALAVYQSKTPEEVTFALAANLRAQYSFSESEIKAYADYGKLVAEQRGVAI